MFIEYKNIFPIANFNKEIQYSHFQRNSFSFFARFIKISIWSFQSKINEITVTRIINIAADELHDQCNCKWE